MTQNIFNISNCKKKLCFKNYSKKHICKFLFKFLLNFLIFNTILITCSTKEITQLTTSTESFFCDQNNFFLCPSNDECIPREWLADGKEDCKDGTDESEIIFNSLQKNFNNQINQVKHEKIVDRNLNELTHNATIIDSENCLLEQQNETKICMIDLKKWLSEFKKLYYENSNLFSIFYNKTHFLKIEEGCKLLTDYLICVEKLPSSCKNNSPNFLNNKNDQEDFDEINNWLEIQMYVCEFIVPSIKEHYDCFTSEQKCFDKFLITNNKRNSLACNFVFATMSDLNCIEKKSNADCDDSAKELFAPLQLETKHVFTDLKCSLNLENSNLSHTFKNTKNIENLTSITNFKNNFDEQLTTKTSVFFTTLNSQTIKSTDARLDKNTWFINQNEIDLSNALFVYSNIDLFCKFDKNNEKNLWAPILVKICAKKKELLQSKKCFNEVYHLTKNVCLSKLEKDVTCNAIYIFNKQTECGVEFIQKLCSKETYKIVIDIKKKLNAEAIAHNCLENISLIAKNASNNDGFLLKPLHRKCSTVEENSSFQCLLELVEISDVLSEVTSVDLLVEFSVKNSSLINKICSNYNKYDSCLNQKIFFNKSRCAFNSPINSLARIGLGSICNKEMKEMLVNGHDCILRAAQKTKDINCQSGLQNLGYTIELMLKGMHSEALLCKTYYIFRDSFECGEKKIELECDKNFMKNFRKIKQQVIDTGVEEGCPIVSPSNIDTIIADPIILSQNTTKVLSFLCDDESQKKFDRCILPLTRFTPHPLAVIKTPKDIEKACEAFNVFKECRRDTNCYPLWARGMSAMFDYSCTEGFEKYAKVKTCIRRITTRNDIRDCVTTFSKSAPQEACMSSKKILLCSIPPIEEKCGIEAKEFVQEFMSRFTLAVDPNCTLENNFVSTTTKAITSVNCTTKEIEIVEKCAEPLNIINSELEILLEGGFQSFLKNVNNLASIFEKGCILIKEYQKCIYSVLNKTIDHTSNCTVSSCFIRASDGICDHSDVSSAIESNLGCVFKQVSNPEFSKCLRFTIANLKQFTLSALREILPKFVDCVEPIVLQNCGSVPLHVLKAFSSQKICPIKPTEDLKLPIVPVTKKPKCTEILLQQYNNCLNNFTSTYTFYPVTLIKYKTQNKNSTTLCTDFDVLSQCIENNRICEKPGKEKALRKLVARICANKNALDQRNKCLNEIVLSNQTKQCLKEYDDNFLNKFNNQSCENLNRSTNCMIESIFSKCPPDSISFVYDYTNGFLRELVQEKKDSCEIVASTIVHQTECSESELINYLECESIIDKFRFQPISIIKNSSKWDDFCSSVENNYSPCLNKLTCKFEPAMSSNLKIFKRLCNSSNDDALKQKKFIQCLNNFTESKEGQNCLKSFRSFDFLSNDVSKKICSVVDSIVNCSTPFIFKKCGKDALAHVYSLHETWMQNFNSSCQLKKFLNNTLEKEEEKINTSTILIEISKKNKLQTETNNFKVFLTTKKTIVEIKNTTMEEEIEKKFEITDDFETTTSNILNYNKTTTNNNTISSTVTINKQTKTISKFSSPKNDTLQNTTIISNGIIQCHFSLNYKLILFLIIASLKLIL